MWVSRAQILRYSDDMKIKDDIETEKETNKVKQDFIIAFKIFLVPVTILAIIGLVVFLSWGILSLLSFLWNVSKILTVITGLIIAYLIILLFVVILNLGED